jgi:hypothetical protein
LVNGLMKQGWPELDARNVLDAALSGPTPPPMPLTRPTTAKPAVMNYASPRPAAGKRAYSGPDKSVHLQRMLIGGALFSIGLIITVVTLAAASSGGTYVLCWGPIIFGGYRMVTGFIGWISS